MLHRKIPPAVALLLVAPVFGELFSGSSPLNEFINPVSFITLVMLYGCGALIIRELVVRWQKGWLSLLLLGCAFGTYEEGLLVQSFFDPSWVDLGILATYGRAAGVNWVWSEHLTIYHAVISIAASIVFVEILYPEQRTVSWVTNRFWWVANWVGFLGMWVIWKIVITYDPGIWRIAAIAAVLLLALAARLVGSPKRAGAAHKTPRPWIYWWSAFLGVLAHFLIIYRIADTGAYPFPVVMALMLAFDLLMLWLIRRWSGHGVSWDDRHRIALINGAMMFFLIFATLTNGSQYPIFYYSNPVFVLLLGWAAYRVNRRERLTFQQG
jgi:hypothetical protein